MTANQIAYWQLQETKRSNLEKESQGRDTIRETGRHNLATEGLEGSKQAETSRHNRQSEYLIGVQTAETQRSNKAREKEEHRSNLVSEANKTLDRKSKEDIAQKDRSSRESIAQQGRLHETAEKQKDRTSSENIAYNRDYTSMLNTKQQTGASDMASQRQMAASKYNTDMQRSIQNRRLDIDAYNALINSLRTGTKYMESMGDLFGGSQLDPRSILPNSGVELVPYR